jgi:glutathione S-transferase
VEGKPERSATVLTLYFCPGSSSMAPHIALHEIGTPFESRPISLAKKENREPAFLALNPEGKVPTLLIDGRPLTEVAAILFYLAKRFPEAGLLPTDPAARALCRSVSGEMHSGFAALRSAMPMNIKGRFEDFKVFSGAQADIARICAVWARCLGSQPGPFLFGERPTMADAMYAPVCSRLTTYGVDLDATSRSYVSAVLALPEMVEWIAAAEAEPDEILELDAEF